MSLPPHKLCPKCGQIAVPTMKVCGRCGYQYARPTPIAWMLGVLCFVCIAFLIGWVITRMSQPRLIGCWSSSNGQPAYPDVVCFAENAAGNLYRGGENPADGSIVYEAKPFQWHSDGTHLTMQGSPLIFSVLDPDGTDSPYLYEWSVSTDGKALSIRPLNHLTYEHTDPVGWYHANAPPQEIRHASQ
jgi:hypothetical protein